MKHDIKIVAEFFEKKKYKFKKKLQIQLNPSTKFSKIKKKTYKKKKK